MSEIEIRLWERAEAAVVKAYRDGLPIRRMAKAVTVAILRELSDEIEKAEENDNMEWPDSDDLAMLADDLEAMS